MIKHILWKNHVPWRVTTDMIFKTMNYYWPNMCRKCEEYVKNMWIICEAMIWVLNSLKAQEKAKSWKTYLNYKMISKVSSGFSKII